MRRKIFMVEQSAFTNLTDLARLADDTILFNQYKLKESVGEFLKLNDIIFTNCGTGGNIWVGFWLDFPDEASYLMFTMQYM